ncbi:TetR/AcrR family transcriptional regulator [Bacillus sp. CMF21]|jgi:AcrR family transcriptional regulator|uniref:TetR/AcrR family transcriptional regulator n=1 Tax=Metabacillus dongyingensis TaxID=2874282 RepID=UPI001CBDB622|nr:TetR/AcrR family transcriptional regulator [Metabacillus dongyingensis]UAL53672.1 TetR/AcrR family transcriptional regulator [Metabacillus dongyingensis]UOK59108.1 TetR/AcrR family transcriptional regulator [Bacillus sp. OVS6]USK29983.1 TetR/AcrR family transcriptional regulator [Bacillus sp. CMF21]
MSRLTPRKLKALQTKQRILETALELFSKKGFDHVTVDEIVSKSQTSKGAFYVHFNSKYEIFLEKFKEIDDFYASFIQSLPSGISSHEKLLLFTQSQMIYLRDSLGKDIMRTVYMSGLIPAQVNYFSNTDRNLYKIVFTLVKEGQEAGEIKTDLSPNEITMLITRCMRGTLYDWLLFEENYDLLDESQKFIRTILGGIQK